MTIVSVLKIWRCCYAKYNPQELQKLDKKTLVIGASSKDERYSNICVRMLLEYRVPMVALGLREGMIGTVPIVTGIPKLTDIHTVSLYIGPRRQPEFYSYVLSLKPKRVIFNPGTENDEFEQLLLDKSIEVEEACTLVMLRSGEF